MNKYKKLSMTFSLLITIVLLSSCKQQGTEFSQVDPVNDINNTNDKNSTGDLPDDEIIDTEVDVILSSCLDAQNNGSMMTYTTQVFFPAAIECEFNEQGNNANEINAMGNGPRQDGKVRARIEQQYNVSLPALGKICDVDFTFPTQAMEYDDEIFLLLNNFVLMASTNYATNSGSNFYTSGLAVDSRGLQTYKWSGLNSLYDLHYGQGVTPRYCLGIETNSALYSTGCKLPATQQLGQIKLDIPQEKVVELGVVSGLLSQSTNLQTELNFGFVSTGDNDNGDCEHSSFGFDIQVKYYIPQQ